MDIQPYQMLRLFSNWFFQLGSIFKALFGESGCFCWIHRGDELHCTVRCQTCLILSKCYTLDLPHYFYYSLRIFSFMLTNLAWSLRFLRPGQNFLNHLVTSLWSFVPLSDVYNGCILTNNEEYVHKNIILYIYSLMVTLE